MQVMLEVTIPMIAKNGFKAHTIIIFSSISNYTINLIEQWFGYQTHAYERGQNAYSALDHNLVQGQRR